ncbi:MAG: hypothetical protein IJ503_10690 [Akkermansia sp.]|nr:hypothetical protein [Akkermansia sp.]
MKILPYTCALLIPAAACHAAAEQIDTHHILAQEIIHLLSETELVLSSCTDKMSTEAALPRLRELAQQAQSIHDRQLKLPNSTLQEDISIATLVQEFQLIWGAICAHIERLDTAGLLTPELREVLRIAPTTN